MKQKIQKLLIAALAILISACGTMSSFTNPTMTDSDFMAATPEARETYLKGIKDEYALISAKKMTEYQAGRPIYIGNGQTGHILQWDSHTRVVYVYPEHKPGDMGVQTYAAAGYATDDQGVPKIGQDGGPVRVYVNVATQEAFGRVAAKAVLGILTSAVNGVGAALVTSNAACKENCGQPPIVMQVQGGSAAAMNRNELSAGAAVGVEMTGGCSRNGGCR